MVQRNAYQGSWLESSRLYFDDLAMGAGVDDDRFVEADSFAPITVNVSAGDQARAFGDHGIADRLAAADSAAGVMVDGVDRW